MTYSSPFYFKKIFHLKYSILIFVIFLNACASPSERFNTTALNLGFEPETTKSKSFQHRIYLSKDFKEGKTLHVYLDGDGTPWERNRWIASDPTARNPLILNLISLDKSPSILLGRPCYYGLNKTQNCDHKLWTSHRYSSLVINSMSNALKHWLKNHHFNEITLIGYSGGGSIAILMANNISGVTKVVTLAANLDVKSWSEFHGYKTLSDSLNPLEQPKPNANIKQFHFAGKEDNIVPEFIIKSFAEQQVNTQYQVIEGIDHACCWDEKWPKILNIIEQ